MRYVSTRGEAPAISFADALGHALILPCARDLVRKLIDRAASNHGVSLQLAFEVNSPAAIKTMVLREGASTIVPYGAVADEIRAGRLQGRRIVEPQIVRRLYLVRPAGGRAFQQEAQIEAFMQRMIGKLSKAVGELVVPARMDGLAEAVAAAGRR